MVLKDNSLFSRVTKDGIGRPKLAASLANANAPEIKATSLGVMPKCPCGNPVSHPILSRLSHSLFIDCSFLAFQCK
jgi:hypothetical protein